MILVFCTLNLKTNSNKLNLEAAMKKKAELVEDLAIILDFIFTIIAVIAGSFLNFSLQSVCFSISGIALVIALIAMFVKKMLK